MQQEINVKTIKKNSQERSNQHRIAKITFNPRRRERDTAARTLADTIIVCVSTANLAISSGVEHRFPDLERNGDRLNGGDFLEKREGGEENREEVADKDAMRTS